MITELAGHGTITENGALRFERLLPGPIERVWAFLTEPEKRSRWLAAGPMDLRSGGHMELIWRNSELSPEAEPVPEKYAHYAVHHMVGKVLRAEPPRLLVHDWRDGSTESEVTYELAEKGDRVLLTLTHRGLPSQSTGTASGWHAHLDILVAVLEERTPAPFWSTHAVLEADYEKRLASPSL
jgi:uncharacterized protein YndB with AHSA1/START domain